MPARRRWPAAALSAPGAPIPTTTTVDHVDTYHGIKVPIPYRWLEDDTSADTAKWVEAQNKVTFAYLDKIPFRAQLTERLKRSTTTPSTASPSRKGDYLFLLEERRPAEPERALHPEGPEGTPEVLHRSEHVVGGRHRAADRRSRRRRTASSPSTASRAAAPTGRNTTCST